MQQQPAVVSDDSLEADFLVAVVRVCHHVLVVAVVRMVHVVILWNEMNVEDADVHSQSRLAVPVEVVRLSRVRHVVRCLQVAGVV